MRQEKSTIAYDVTGNEPMLNLPLSPSTIAGPLRLPLLPVILLIESVSRTRSLCRFYMYFKWRVIFGLFIHLINVLLSRFPTGFQFIK